jgi:hypothetical protein
MLTGDRLSDMRTLARISGGGYDQLETDARRFLSGLEKDVASGTITNLRTTAAALAADCQGAGFWPSDSSGSGATGVTGNS